MSSLQFHNYRIEPCQPIPLRLERSESLFSFQALIRIGRKLLLRQVAQIFEFERVRSRLHEFQCLPTLEAYSRIVPSLLERMCSHSRNQNLQYLFYRVVNIRSRWLMFQPNRLYR